MARANITLPDDLLERSRAAGLNVSGLASAALREELDRRAKLAALDDYLRDLDAALGPIPSAERQAARSWADREFGSRADAEPAHASPPRDPA